MNRSIPSLLFSPVRLRHRPFAYVKSPTAPQDVASIFELFVLHFALFEPSLFLFHYCLYSLSLLEHP